jgi:hypothetical protein
MKDKIYKNKNIVDIRTIIINSDMNTFCKINKIKILKLKKANYKKIANELSKLSDKDNIEKIFYRKEMLDFLNSLDKVGRPDYFIWSDKEFYFAEYKSRFDFLRQKQYDWFHKYFNVLPIIIIQSSNIK